MADVSFKISTGLKNIIGRDLITDDFIAVFELVKNSFDANARNVEISFCKPKKKAPYIIIKDDGVGMNEDDLINKWLFVAYSAKKSDEDYRNQIAKNRLMAGAKGIGRFSCDKLGARLNLVTRKNDEENKCFSLSVDWRQFEDKPEEEFQTINAQLRELSEEPPINKNEAGTLLKITKLRAQNWNRDKFLKLRKSLEKLINPNQENDSNNFNIILNVPSELSEDQKSLNKKTPEPWNVVNGPIQNFIFETLELKTTQIQLEIDKQGEFLNTRLIDRGKLVYEILENNPFPEHLHEIKIALFYLGKSAKSLFTRRMGVRNFNYGSVFLYKNGFRIYPFGEPSDDSLKIDARKLQGVFRRLGTRDISGRIEIEGDNPYFVETSSRDGGLIKNNAYASLQQLFIDYALMRLEGYVIELAKFGKGMDEIPELNSKDSKKFREKVFDIIVNLTNSTDVIAIDYDPNVLDVLENQSSKSVSALLNNLKKISLENDNPHLFDEVKKAERQVAILKKAKEEAERETIIERKRATKAEKTTQEAIVKKEEAEANARNAQEEVEKSQEQVKALRTQTHFLENVVSKEMKHVLELHHTIGQEARTIEQISANLLSIVKENQPLDRKEFKDDLEQIDYIARKIITVSRFAIQANFQPDEHLENTDLVTFLREYLLNIHAKILSNIEIHFEGSDKDEFITTFNPISVSMVVDNLISNSQKHKAKNIVVKVVEVAEQFLKISFKDDGNGIDKTHFPHIFDIGYTTTELGSGLGLSHSRELMNEMGGEITANAELKNGAEFFLGFNKL